MGPWVLIIMTCWIGMITMLSSPVVAFVLLRVLSISKGHLLSLV